MIDYSIYHKDFFHVHQLKHKKHDYNIGTLFVEDSDGWVAAYECEDDAMADGICNWILSLSDERAEIVRVNDRHVYLDLDFD